MNYYELLGINNNATFDEIKQAYKKQMKIWHPDINKSENAITMAAKINEAKEVLLDEKKRKEYDDYLNKKVEEDYNKYTQQKNNNDYSQKNDNNNMITKWQYLKDWLNYANVSFFRKIIGLFFVLLESLFCLLLKYFIIFLVFVIFFLCDIIKTTYEYFSIIFIGFAIYLAFIYAYFGLNSLLTDYFIQLKIFIISISIYLLAHILPKLGNKLLSKEVFAFLYNKIDINLFKLAVGFKE